VVTSKRVGRRRGRPIKYDDAYHEGQREAMRRYRALKRIRAQLVKPLFSPTEARSLVYRRNVGLVVDTGWKKGD
jgi:hypothetical protein